MRYTLFPMSTQDFGKWLKGQLDERRMSQTELAHIIGVRPAQISRMVSGDRGPGPVVLWRIAEAFQISLEDLFRMAFGIQSKKPPRSGADKRIEEIQRIVFDLPDAEAEDVVRYARYQLRVAEEGKQYEGKKKRRVRESPVRVERNGQ